MPYFKNENVNILFIHIPKTGGTSVVSYFSSKFNIPLNNTSLYAYMDDQQKLNENICIHSSLQHVTYNQILTYNNFFNIDFKNITIFTIVRNPNERIISDLFWYKKIKVDTTTDEVLNIIHEYLLSESYDNHNLPQHIFITNANKELIENIHVLKTENLIKDMHDLGYTDFNIIENYNPNKINCYDYLNNESIRIINDFYHFDFMLFNYSKIMTPLDK